MSIAATAAMTPYMMIFLWSPVGGELKRASKNFIFKFLSVFSA